MLLQCNDLNQVQFFLLCAGQDCAVDEIADCDLAGLDMHMLLSRWQGGLEDENLWAATGASNNKTLWLGPRSCKCVQAWMNAIGPQAPHNDAIKISCMASPTQSMAEVREVVNSGKGKSVSSRHTHPLENILDLLQRKLYAPETLSVRY